MDKLKNILLIAAILLSVAVYSLWDIVLIKTGVAIFYIGSAFFISILCLYIWLSNKNYLTFILFSLSLNNLIDELFFDNTKFGLNEAAFAVVLIGITYLRYARKTTKHN